MVLIFTAGGRGETERVSSVVVVMASPLPVSSLAARRRSPTSIRG
jgi:hypothetical protein